MPGMEWQNIFVTGWPYRIWNDHPAASPGFLEVDACVFLQGGLSTRIRQMDELRTAPCLGPLERRFARNFQQPLSAPRPSAIRPGNPPRGAKAESIRIFRNRQAIAQLLGCKHDFLKVENTSTRIIAIPWASGDVWGGFAPCGYASRPPPPISRHF